MRPPPELYAISLVALMEQQNVHHFVVDMDAMNPENSRGLSIDFEIVGRKITVSTGRGDCPAGLAKTGGPQ
jgi:hypothetical protein